MNMNNEKNDRSLSLSPEERMRMRSAVRTYVTMKPAPAIVAAQTIWTLDWLYSPRAIAATLVLALFASSAGVSFAASDALPGDVLYGIKTNINEPISGALAVTAQAKSDWAITVASTRLQEAATLAAEGRLNAQTEVELKQSFDTHAQEAAKLIAEQASTSPDTGVTSAVSFEAQLSEYQRVLTQVGMVTDSQTESLASAVRDAQATVGSIRANAQAKVALSATTSNSAETLAASRMRDIAKQQLRASLKLADSADGSLATSSAAQVAVQLDNASAAISEGEAFLASDSAPEASGAFQNALSAANKLGVFLKTSFAIHARTGLTIGDAATSTISTSHKSAAAVRALKAAVTSVSATVPTAVSASFKTVATTSDDMATSSDEHANTDSNVSAQTTVENSGDSSGDHGGDKKDSGVLPLSVPTDLLLQ